MKNKLLPYHYNRVSKYGDIRFNRHLDRHSYLLTREYFESRGIHEHSFLVNKRSSRKNRYYDKIDSFESRVEELKLEETIRKIIKEHSTLFSHIED